MNLSKDEISAWRQDAGAYADMKSRETGDEWVLSYDLRLCELARADLVAELETLRYEVDAIAGILQERDELQAVLAKLRGNVELPGHPEPHTYTWSKLEIEAIEQYGDARALAASEQDRADAAPPLYIATHNIDGTKDTYLAAMKRGEA